MCIFEAICQTRGHFWRPGGSPTEKVSVTLSGSSNIACYKTELFTVEVRTSWLDSNICTVCVLLQSSNPRALFGTTQFPLEIQLCRLASAKIKGWSVVLGSRREQTQPSSSWPQLPPEQRCSCCRWRNATGVECKNNWRFEVLRTSGVTSVSVFAWQLYFLLAKLRLLFVSTHITWALSFAAVWV